MICLFYQHILGTNILLASEEEFQCRIESCQSIHNHLVKESDELFDKYPTSVKCEYQEYRDQNKNDCDRLITDLYRYLQCTMSIINDHKNRIKKIEIRKDDILRRYHEFMQNTQIEKMVKTEVPDFYSNVNRSYAEINAIEQEIKGILQGRINEYKKCIRSLQIKYRDLSSYIRKYTIK